MTDGWAGFRATPRPLLGVSQQEVSKAFATSKMISEVIGLLTTTQGLSLWLGEVADLKIGVGAKFSGSVNGESIQSLFTCLDLPGHVVFMNERLGEFDFRLSESKTETKISAIVRRAVTPEELGPWAELANSILQRFEQVAASA